ncbi:GNAT family N-acetyltransferase [Isoptericola croceus]|uniref:GNAT family N-acetyltransferase n=1 Tax=Isoptericola croceus TaxID=3031406 RepID=UPI0023F75E5D|nr:GNAT family N-acetyltransferase [Isoptericola croceus]
MSTGTPAWRIVAAPHPTSLHDPTAWAYHGIAELERAAGLADLGHADAAWTAAAVHADVRHQDHVRTVRLVAVAPDGGTPGDVVGAATLWGDLDDNRTWADVTVMVHPRHRRRGIGTALADRIEAEAADDGRRTVLTEVAFGEPAPGDRLLTPPTDTGHAPADHPGVAFALARGYRLEQVERRSVLSVPVEPARLERLAADALEHAPGYRLHTWHDEIPATWLAGFAALETRMSTDVPSGEMDWAEEVWDTGRVRDLVARHHESGDGFVVTAAEHVATGELAAMTMLLFPTDDGESADQEDTIVLQAHRGHRLGMLVKAVNLQALARRRPSTRRVHTGNAAENAHMLAINEALGFRAEGGSATLRLTQAGR